MAKLMTVTNWKNREFADGSQPQNKTIKQWIEDGKIRGVVDDDGRSWVYENVKFGVSDEVMNLVRQS